ncbi:MAG: tripartite tricarboxylate transporter permease [Desulfobacterales bacterium]|nr:tripartite tricarboxylate transporter permease [Desulfobacterales bacterium]
MVESIWEGFRLLLDWQVIGLLLFGVCLGNFFGAVPGLGGNLGLALLIPFVFGMRPFAGLTFLLAMHSVVHTGGSIPGILFGIPGTGPTVATIVDGYPMTQQGRGGEAMGAQLAASGLGGVIGALILALLIPVLRPITMAFGSPEVLMLIVFGLTFIIVISRESMAKGSTAALLGLLLGTVGLNPHTGVGRFTFDQLWLWDGFHIVIIVLGIFAFAEMLELGARGRKAKIAQGDINMSWKQLWDGSKAVFTEWWLSLRTAVIGTIIGIIPGLGGDAATWICYGHAAQTCKNTENFGKGDIRGVIAVETANNAKEGGALLPTLGFGIPGSSGMAILLGAFIILGISPGPKMLTDHLDLVWGMVWVLVIANIIGAVSLYPLCRYMGMLAFLRGSLLIPPIMILASIGAFLIRGMWQDMILAVLFGFFGYAMKKCDFPRAPLIMGFILGYLAEDYLHKSLGAWGFSFLLRPVVLSLLILSVASVVYSLWQASRKSGKNKVQEKFSTGNTVFSLLWMIIFSGALIVSLTFQWSMKAKLFPIIISLAGSAFSLWLLYDQFFRQQREDAPRNIPQETGPEKDEDKKPILRRDEIIIFLWLAGFLTLNLLFGFWISIAIFMLLFLTLFGRENWKTVTLYTAGMWVSMHLVFQIAMKTELFEGLLELFG